MREECGDSGYRTQCNDEKDDNARREGKGCQVEAQKAALFLFSIGDIQGIEDCLYTGVGAPDRQSESDQQSQPQLGFIA